MHRIIFSSKYTNEISIGFKSRREHKICLPLFQGKTSKKDERTCRRRQRERLDALIVSLFFSYSKPVVHERERERERKEEKMRENFFLAPLRKRERAEKKEQEREDFFGQTHLQKSFFFSV